MADEVYAHPVYLCLNVQDWKGAKTLKGLWLPGIASVTPDNREAPIDRYSEVQAEIRTSARISAKHMRGDPMRGQDQC
jgi:hypothetical protein